MAVGAQDARKIFVIYALNLLMYTVASPDPDPDPNPRGGGQLPNLKSAIPRQRVQRGRDANPNPKSAILR